MTLLSSGSTLSSTPLSPLLTIDSTYKSKVKILSSSYPILSSSSSFSSSTSLSFSTFLFFSTSLFFFVFLFSPFYSLLLHSFYLHFHLFHLLYLHFHCLHIFFIYFFFSLIIKFNINFLSLILLFSRFTIIKINT